jgi:hypothetical protein
MSVPDDTYNAALGLFHDAVAALCSGEHERAEHLLASLDTEAIERERRHLVAIARTARACPAPQTALRADKTVSRRIKEAVQQRDGFRCRFTGRRLIDTRVFKEVSRLSSVFHFDEHHAVYETKRGRGGHPLVRTHGAAYEHALPLSHGGLTSIENIFLISVQLNESKGAKILDRVDVSVDGWKGLTEFLPTLSAQRSAAPLTSGPTQSESRAVGSSVTRPSAARSRNKGAVERLRRAADGLSVTVYALADGAEVENAFLELRRSKRNAFFANERKAGTWMIHRMYCSSLAFAIDVKLTASPKVYSESQAQIDEWAKRAEVTTTVCTRCGKVV